MDYVPETLVSLSENGCNQVNPISTMYSQQSAHQHKNKLVHTEMKCLPKRQAQTWENDCVKIPKLSVSHLSPRGYSSLGVYGFTSDVSNPHFSDHSTVLQRGMQHSQATQMDVAVDVSLEHSRSGHYSGEHLNKLSAQKIAIGI